MVNNYTLAKYQEEYKVEYKIPAKHTEIFNQVKGKIHNIVVTSVNAIKGPNLVMKVARSVVKALGYIPELNPNLVWTNGFLKDCKTVSNWINGTQSIDSILNGKFSWKIAALTISGLALFTLSNITIAEKLLINCNTIKASLAVIPALRSLPFGGLLNISLLGLFGSLLSISLDKGYKLGTDIEKNKVKLAFWKETAPKQVLKIKAKIADLETKITKKSEQLDKGMQVVDLKDVEEKLKRAHLNALKDIQENLQKEKDKLINLSILRDKSLNDELFKAYQNAKMARWTAKLQKVEIAKSMNMGSNYNFGISMGKQLAILGTVGTGYGLSLLSSGLMVAGLASLYISLRGRNMKNEMSEIRIAPVRVS